MSERLSGARSKQTPLPRALVLCLGVHMDAKDFTALDAIHKFIHWELLQAQSMLTAIRTGKAVGDPEPVEVKVRLLTEGVEALGRVLDRERSNATPENCQYCRGWRGAHALNCPAIVDSGGLSE